MYLNEKMEKYLDNLADKTPTPGGGSASAFTATLATGLISMVCNFTIGKEKYKNVEKEIIEILNKSEHLRKSLSFLIDADTEVYQKLADAFKLPKTLEEKRKQKIQECSKDAIDIPVKIINDSFEILNLSYKLVFIGNKNLITDIGVAVNLAEAAIDSAMLNIKVNLMNIEDISYKHKILDTIHFILKETKIIKEKVIKEVKKQLE